MTKTVLGVILAGGRAQRMGGGDKGLHALGKGNVIGAVIARLRGQCDAMVLNANGDPARFAACGLDVVADDLPGHPGPLAGVLAGMEAAAARGFGHVLTAAADTPFLPPDLRTRLEAARQAQSRPIALAATRAADGRLIRHPTFGLWPVDLRHDLRDAITDGIAKIVLWTDRHGTAIAEFPTDPVDPFFNINTPDDLETARALERRLSP